MLDFTSALYLGLRHGSGSLRPWRRLSTGVPAALAEAPEARAVASRLAALLGCERAVLAPSTLHLFWDLVPILAAGEVTIHVEAGTYPIARWGVERAAARGAPVRTFAHHDPDDLRRRLRREARRRARPLVVADGLCVDCGRSAPLRAYLEAVRERDGVLVVDDSQALGLLGEDPGPGRPYGSGGGGSLRLHGIEGPDIVVGASLAKAFGVPVAVLAAARPVVAAFAERSETRVHSSPPSVPVLRAAERALEVNDLDGDALRLRLGSLVRRFRKGLAGLGLAAAGGRLPVQTIAADFHERLLAQGIRTVRRQTGVTFLITALHGPADVDRALRALDVVTRSGAGRRERRIP